MTIKIQKYFLAIIGCCFMLGLTFIIYIREKNYSNNPVLLQQQQQNHHNHKQQQQQRQQQPQAEKPTTPHLIHFISLGAKSHLLDNFFRRHIEQCLQVNQHYKFVLWTEKNTKRLLKMKEITKSMAMNMNANVRDTKSRSQLLRYLVLYLFGGVYMDLATLCQQQIDLFITNRSLCYWSIEPPLQAKIVYKTNNVTMNNFIFCPPRHPFVKQLLNNIDLKIKQKDIAWNFTGPLDLGRLFKSYKLNKTNPIQVVDYHLFFPNVNKKSIKQIYCKNKTENFKINKNYCIEMNEYIKWLDETGEGNAVLVYDWSHLNSKKQHVFDAVEKFPKLQPWPTTT